MIVLASKGGALANRLWVLAHLVAVAAETRSTVAGVAFDEYADDFVTTSDDLLCRFPARRSRLRPTPRRRRAVFHAWRLLAAALARTVPRTRWWALVRLDWEQRLDLGDPSSRALLRRPLVVAQGWLLRDEAALARQADLVRAHLAPQPQVLAHARAAVSGLRQSCGVVVGVHVRRGDYGRFRGGRYYYALEQYRELVRHLALLLDGRSPGFLVASDEPLAAAELDVGSPLVVASGSAVQDLYALAQCDYLIGPPSTFSLWASFVGEVPTHLVEDPSHLPTLEEFSLMQAAFRNGEPTARTMKL